MKISRRLGRLINLAVNDRPYLIGLGKERLRRRGLFDYRVLSSGRAQAPISVTFEVTHRCNLHCYMCDLYGTGKDLQTLRAKREDRENALSEAEDLRILTELAKWRPTISLTGGEPFSVPRGLRLLQTAKKLGLATSVVTNGTWLSRDAERLVEIGVDTVMVSIDGPREIHDSIRGVKGAFDRMASGLKRIHEIKKVTGKRKPHLEINTVICGRNSRHLVDMIEVARELGVDRLQYAHLWFWPERNVDLHNRMYGDFAPCDIQNLAGLVELDVEAVIEQIARIKDYQGSIRIRFLPDLKPEEVRSYYLEPGKIVKKRRCIAPWLAMRIMPDGEIIPCLDVKIGNVREATLSELWNSENYRKFRRLIKENRLLPGCLRCCKLFSF